MPALAQHLQDADKQIPFRLYGCSCTLKANPRGPVRWLPYYSPILFGDTHWDVPHELFVPKYWPSTMMSNILLAANSLVKISSIYEQTLTSAEFGTIILT